MRWHLPARFGRARSRRFLSALFLCLSASVTLLADTPSLLRTVPSTGCYCHCAESHARSGCAKMCETKKYATRWWATTCVKPHMHSPIHKYDAGPRLPHPDRAEHAQVR